MDMSPEGKKRRRDAASINVRSHLMPSNAENMCAERYVYVSKLEMYQKREQMKLSLQKPIRRTNEN
jgi:hypothetical protein